MQEKDRFTEKRSLTTPVTESAEEKKVCNTLEDPDGLDEVEKEALKKLKRLEEDYISPDSGISSGLALPPARYVYMAGIFVALFLLLYLLASALESGRKNTPSSVKRTGEKLEEILKK